MSGSRGLPGLVAGAAWALAACALVAAPAQGAVLLQETFPTDTTSTAETIATYTNFNYTGGGSGIVTGGVLNMAGTGITHNLLTNTGFPGDLVIQLDVGKNPGGGSANVGLAIGSNRLVFHPGYTGGAFRVEGPGGFGNQDMGFTPAAGPGVFNLLEVSLLGATGQFLVAITNGNNPDQVYATRFTNAGYAPGSAVVGPTRGCGGTDEVGLFDNLVIAERPTISGDTAWERAVAAAGPLHWYRLNETGTAICIDYGSAQLDGVYQNGVVRGQSGIPFEGDLAARFDGVDDRVWLGASSLAGPWSAEFVLMHLAVEDTGSLLRSSSGALRLDQWQNTGRVGYTAFGVADYLVTPDVIVPLDEWVHLVYVADPVTGIQVYLNGVLAGSNPNYMPLPRDLIGGSDTANMLLDEVVLYDRALTAQEILGHASALGIPEPGSLALLALGLLALRRRRRA